MSTGNKFRIKVEVAVYRADTDDLDDVIRLEVGAVSSDEKAAVKFANDVHDAARKLLAERSK